MNRIKTITRHLRPWSALLLAVLLLASPGCVKRELEQWPDAGFVEIALDWGGDPRPGEARYLFYDENGVLAHEESGVRDCFRGDLPPGTYRLVVHNTDAAQVDWRGTDKYHTAEVFARETDYSGGSHPPSGTPCILEPQAVFGTGSCNETDLIEVVARDTVRLTTTPAELTRKVALRLVNSNIPDLEALSGVLGGVAPGMFMATASHNASHSCAVEFTAVAETSAASVSEAAAAGSVAGSSAGAYTAGVNVFNLLTTEQSQAGTNTLSLNLTLSGQLWHLHFDITAPLQDILRANGGSYPDTVSLEVILKHEGTLLSGEVVPWDETGTGGGPVTPGN